MWTVAQTKELPALLLMLQADSVSIVSLLLPIPEVLSLGGNLGEWKSRRGMGVEGRKTEEQKRKIRARENSGTGTSLLNLVTD